MSKYKINKNTLAIIPINEQRSKIYEGNNVIIVNQNSKSIIEENCIYYGSSYQGRRKATADLTGVTHKSPIIVEDSNLIIFFPTASPRTTNCGWISSNNIEAIYPNQNQSVVKFQNDLSIHLPVSGHIINNQLLRATRLESIVRKRKDEINQNNN